MIQESLYKIAGIILCVIMLFVIPTLYSFERQDDIVYNLVNSATNELSQRVREVGYIDRELYHEYINRLSATGLSYQVEMSHMEKRYGQNQGRVEVYYHGYYQEEIEEYLKGNDRYPMKIGDFFYIKVQNTGRTKGDGLKSMIGIPTSSLPRIYLKSGGIVRYGGA
ncbi:MAG: hypothetical protein JW708_02105 [Vallitaleaceae bacterium]|nr:hypothetical protein [Vallitaleaceae bacterium]